MVLPVLGFLLHFVRAREVFEEVCVQPNRTVVVSAAPRKCPCLLKATLVSRQPVPDLSASVYTLHSTDFTKWLTTAREARRSGQPLPIIPGTRVGVASFTAPHSRTGNYGWESRDITVPNDGNGEYVTIVVATGVMERSCFLSSVSFEWKPSTCPLRFEPSSVANRVVGGSIVSQENDNGGEFASYNALVRTARGRCSASVLSSRWILTAAHCQVPKGATVYVGGQRLNDGARHTVESVFSHPDFKSEINRTGNSVNAVRIVNDVALLRLSRPISKARPITLNINHTGPPAGTVVRATGYGQKSTRVHSKRLRMVDITLLATEECRRRFSKAGRREIANGLNGDINVCIGGDEQCQGGVCFGDSGGPVVGRNVDGELLQLGVVSYGDTVCGSWDSADVYVKVSQYIPWIQEVTGGAATVGNWGTAGKIKGTREDFGRGALPTWTIVTVAIAAIVVVTGTALIILRSRRSSLDGTNIVIDAGQNVTTNSRSNTRSTVEDDSIPEQIIIVESENDTRTSEEDAFEIRSFASPLSAYRPRGSVNTQDLD